MYSETVEHNRGGSSLIEDCRRCLSFHIILTLKDGSCMDGIIQEVKENSIILLVGEDVMEEGDCNQRNGERQPFHGGPRRFRRFRPRPFPINSIATLALLRYPFIFTPFPFFP